MNNFYFIPLVHFEGSVSNVTTTISTVESEASYIDITCVLSAFLSLYGISLALYSLYFILRLRNVDFEFKSFWRNWSELDWMAIGCITSQCLKTAFLQSSFTFIPTETDGSILLSTKAYLVRAVVLDFCFFLTTSLTSTYFIIYLVTVSDGLQIYKHIKIWGVKIMPLPGLKLFTLCKVICLTIPIVLICTKGLESPESFNTFLFYEFIQYALGSLFILLPMLLYFGLPILLTLKKGFAAKKTASNRKIPIIALTVLIYTAAIFGFVLNSGACCLISISSNKTLNSSPAIRTTCIVIINLLQWFSTSFFSVFSVFKAFRACSASSRSNSFPSPMLKLDPSAESKEKSISFSPPIISGQRSSLSTSTDMKMTLPYFSPRCDHQEIARCGSDGYGISILLTSREYECPLAGDVDGDFSRLFDSRTSNFSPIIDDNVSGQIDSCSASSFLEIEVLKSGDQVDWDCTRNLRLIALDD